MGYANPIERYDLAGAFIATPQRPAWTACWWWTTRPRSARPSPPAAAHGLDLIFLLAPTSTDERMAAGRAHGQRLRVLRVAQGRDRRRHLDTGAVAAMLPRIRRM
jgi:tryptophan synthase alpha chain